MTAHDWASAADPERRIGRRVEFHSEIGSTNDRARVALADPDGDGLAVVADLQTAGRGRHGRTWESPPGANLMVSVGLRPRLTAGRAGLLGIAAALAVRDACATFVRDDGLRVKWPNDVVAADGRKVAGLLLETVIQDDTLAEAIIGMGINANWQDADMPLELAGRAVSLYTLAGVEIDRVALLERLLDRLDVEVTQLEAGKTPLSRLAEVSALDGRVVTVDVGEALLHGIAMGVTSDGQLQLDTESGRRTLAIGEVVAVRDASSTAAVS